MSTFIDAFDRFDSQLNGGAGHSQQDNLLGVLAWQEAPMMMSYATMYRATHQVDYLHRLLLHIYNVLNQRDDRHNRSDYRGVVGPTWVSTAYSVDDISPYAWIVHSGMITYPMADFAHIVTSDPQLHNELSATGEPFLQHAARIRTAVEETISAHDDQWDDTAGVYRCRPDAPTKIPGQVLPHNMYAAMGRTLLVMYRLTGTPEYLYKVIKLALYLRTHLEPDLDRELYTWDYRVGDSKVEDISHGAIDVDFAALCQEHGVVFNANDIRWLASTFINNVYLAPLRFANRVDGSDGEGNVIAAGQWLALARVQRDMFQIVADYFADVALANNETSGSVFDVLANLQRCQHLLEPIAVNRLPGSASRWAGVAAGDFDGDGVDEFVAVRNFDGRFLVYRLGTGGAVEDVASLPGTASSEWAGVAAGDFDGDGKDEFVAVRNLDGDLFMYRLAGGIVEPVARLTSPGPSSQWAGVAAGDFDGDGRDEFVAVRNFDGNFYMYRLGAGGAIESVAVLTSPGSASRWAGVAAGDFDGDGKAEFVGVRNFDGNFYMYRLASAGTMEPVASLTAPGSASEWRGITAGDFDGDGQIEFAANRNFDGDFYIYRLSNGAIRTAGHEFFPRDLENGILGAGYLTPTPPRFAALIMARNYDGDIFVFRTSSLT